jgi:hypothetical protein
VLSTKTPDHDHHEPLLLYFLRLHHRIRKRHATRALHHKHAAKVADHARIVLLHAKELLRLQQEIEREAAAIAGADYKECHDMGYDSDEYGSMESQRAVDDGTIVGPGLVDVVELATSIATYAGSVAAEATPPPLPS